MPYLEPERVLEQFSQFARTEVRSAIADDERTTRAQVGSMASTLQFLSKELAGRETSLDDQRSALEAALADVEGRLAEVDGSNPVNDAVVDAKKRLGETNGAYCEREAAVLETSTDLLVAIDGTLDGAEARMVRRPLYDFLDELVASQLRLLGGEPDI